MGEVLKDTYSYGRRREPQVMTGLTRWIEFSHAVEERTHQSNEAPPSLAIDSDCFVAV